MRGEYFIHFCWCSCIIQHRWDYLEILPTLYTWLCIPDCTLTWLVSSSSKDSNLAIGASSVDLNSHDSVVPASDPLESSLLVDLQPSSSYWEEESEDGKSYLCNLGGRSVVLTGGAKERSDWSVITLPWGATNRVTPFYLSLEGWVTLVPTFRTHNDYFLMLGQHR